MARLWTNGFEDASLLFWDYGGHFIRSDGPRSGVYYNRLDYEAEGIKYTPNLTEFWLRFGYRVGGESLSGRYIPRIRKDGNVLAHITLEGGYPALYVGATRVGVSPHKINANTWYLLEVHFKIGTSNGQFELKTDGVLSVSFTGNTDPTSQGLVNNLMFKNFGGSYSDLDDLALNDPTGTEDNGWCGDGRVIALNPDGNGDTIQWTASSGSNYQCVDEGLPGNGDTDYVYTEYTNRVDLYTLQNPSIPSESIIRRVWVTAVARKTTSDPATLALGIKTNNAEYWGSAQDLLTSYKVFHSQEYTKNPNTNNEWTLSDINNLQAGIKSG